MKKRLILATAGVGAVGLFAALGAVGTNALFDAQANSQTDTITAGTLSVGSPATTSCAVNDNLYPGENPIHNECTFTVTTGGTLDALVALDVTIETSSGSQTGAVNLYSPSDPDGLAVNITSEGSGGGVQSYATPSAAITPPDSSFTAAYNETNVPVRNANGTYGSYMVFHPGDSVTFNVLATLPSWSGNAYQGGAATIILKAHAVQATNNECWNADCSTTRPFITYAEGTAGSSSSNGSITLTYANGTHNLSTTVTPGTTRFYLVDMSQSGQTPVYATLSNWTLVTPQSAKMSLSALSNGSYIKSGDYLSLYYEAETGAGLCPPASGLPAGQWYPTTNCGGSGAAYQPVKWDNGEYTITNQMIPLFKVS